MNIFKRTYINIAKNGKIKFSHSVSDVLGWKRDMLKCFKLSEICNITS